MGLTQSNDAEPIDDSQITKPEDLNMASIISIAKLEQIFAPRHFQFSQDAAFQIWFCHSENYTIRSATLSAFQFLKSSDEYSHTAKIECSHQFTIAVHDKTMFVRFSQISFSKYHGGADFACQVSMHEQFLRHVPGTLVCNNGLSLKLKRKLPFASFTSMPLELFDKNPGLNVLTDKSTFAVDGTGIVSLKHTDTKLLDFSLYCTHTTPIEICNKQFYLNQLICTSRRVDQRVYHDDSGTVLSVDAYSNCIIQVQDETLRNVIAYHDIMDDEMNRQIPSIFRNQHGKAKIETKLLAHATKATSDMSIKFHCKALRIPILESSEMIIDFTISNMIVTNKCAFRSVSKKNVTTAGITLKLHGLSILFGHYSCTLADLNSLSRTYTRAHLHSVPSTCYTFLISVVGLKFLSLVGLVRSFDEFQIVTMHVTLSLFTLNMTITIQMDKNADNTDKPSHSCVLNLNLYSMGGMASFYQGEQVLAKVTVSGSSLMDHFVNLHRCAQHGNYTDIVIN